MREGEKARKVPTLGPGEMGEWQDHSWWWKRLRQNNFGISSEVKSFIQTAYMTTGKTIALTRRTFVSKVLSLLFNMQSS